jgi:uncharacterized protein YjgD (DUF1641 family)
MSRPISLDLPRRDPREELRARLEQAPAEHAEAVLALYEILQGLHDSGALETVRGALGARDKIITEIVELSKTPESVRGIRNLIILAKALGSIEPSHLQALVGAAPEALAQARSESAAAPSLWSLFKKVQSKDSRRGLALAASMLESAGKNLAPPPVADDKPKHE